METEYLGFEEQPSWEGSCGAYSFGHTMNLLGIPTSIGRSKILCKYVSPKDSFVSKLEWEKLKKIRSLYDLFDEVGTIESGLREGIKRNHCIPISINTESRKEAKKFIEENLSDGNPIILSVNWDYDYEDDGHWMVCAGKYKNKYIIIDSAPEDYIVDLYSWTELEDRFVWFEDEDDKDGYYEFNLIAVEPNSSSSCVKQMKGTFPELYNDEYLQEWWGYYLSDLIDVSENNFSAQNGSILLHDFLSNSFDKIVDNIVYWLSDIDKKDLEYELRNYLIVAKAYQFFIPANKNEEVLLSFSSALIGAMLY